MFTRPDRLYLLFFSLGLINSVLLAVAAWRHDLVSAWVSGAILWVSLSGTAVFGVLAGASHE